jgi:hypothetical protein
MQRAAHVRTSQLFCVELDRTYKCFIIINPAHYSPLLDIGLSNCSPSRSIFGYSHSSCSSSYQPSCPSRHSTLHLPKCGPHSRTRLPQRLSVIRLIWPAHCHFKVIIRCTMSLTLIFCRITSFGIQSRRVTIKLLSIARWAWTCGPTSRDVTWVSNSQRRMSWPVERADWRLSSLGLMGSTMKRLNVISQMLPNPTEFFYLPRLQSFFYPKLQYFLEL